MSKEKAQEPATKPSEEEAKDEIVSGKKVVTFAAVGAALTVLDFLIYNIVLQVFYNGNADGASVAGMISGVLATIVAYFAHNNITWKARKPRKYGVAWFFGWNILMATGVRPVILWFFGLVFFSRIYDFAFSIISWLNIPLDYEIVKSTGVYVLMTCVVMVLNYTFYEKLVFGEKKK
ncbi:MAG: GtrA family protein [Candidatus Saccharibacteria bacterium]|nr:GtrA family protein [Candidatus Saccharibacteria bacterium]